MNHQDELRVPPHSQQAEQAVLGSLMIDNQAFDAVGSVLSADDFYREDHRLIYRSIAALAADDKPLDWITLSEWLKQRDQLDQAGGDVYLGTLAKDTPSSANIKHYADIVRERSQRRQIIAFGVNIIEQAYTEGELAPGELIDSAETTLFQLSEASREGKSAITPIKQGMKEALSQIEENAARPVDELLGTSTSFDDLDKLLDGLQDSNLITVGARPSMGKTAFIGDLELAAATSGKTVVSFNMEMPTVQLVYRYMAKQSGVDLRKIRKAATLVENDWVRIAQATKPLANLPLYSVNKPGMTINDIRAIARRMQRESLRDHGTGLGLITIDYLQLITKPMGSGTKNDAALIGDMSRALKVLAMELNCPIVLLSQLNRSLETRPNKRPVMSDLRESGAIEQDSDDIMFLYRDEVYDEDSADKGFAEIIISKQRNGPTGTVKLAFNGPCTRFENPTWLPEGDDFD